MTRDERPPLLGRWIGWRLRGLIGIALLACVSIYALVRVLAETPVLPLDWRAGELGAAIVDAAGADARTLRSITVDGRTWPVDATLLAVAPRFQLDAARRADTVALHAAIARTRAPVRLDHDRGPPQQLSTAPRGAAGLPWALWPLAAVALAVVLVGGVVGLAQPHAGNLYFLAITVCQFVNLLLLAVSLAPGIGLPPTLVQADAPLRTALDLAVAALAVCALSSTPPQGSRLGKDAMACVAVAACCTIAAVLTPLPGWLPQLVVLALGAAVVASARTATQGSVATSTPPPVLGVTATWLAAGWLLGVAAAIAIAAVQWGALDPVIGQAGALVWGLVPALLLLAPLALRSRQALREFALLAGVSAVAAAMDLLFVSVFSLDAFASLALVVFVALGAYAGTRQWLFDRLLANQALTTERLFDQLYRAAREVQAHPESHAAQLAALLRGLFDPLDVVRSPQPLGRARVAGGGASLRVPLLPLPHDGESDGDGAVRGALVLHHAGRGRRVFTREDARLADRVVEQLRRAVAYDSAVERGRSEERARIAQDLHDDIGARLLTLMYQAPNAEMEDYVRHTLKDLKTLTRGLAAGDQRWSHAVAEWKADIAQRLGAARIELVWMAEHDEDPRLSVVQWSALTRVLRELVSNAIHHAHATQVQVRLHLQAQRLELSVTDDGQGADPAAWSQGLGLGGVKKRVKLLGGQVRWRAAAPQGIVCEVTIPSLAATATRP